MSHTPTEPISDGRNANNNEAHGQDFAIQTLAETRYHTKQFLRHLDATSNVSKNSIFLPENHDRTNIHARTHAAVLSYLDELAKPTYLTQPGIKQFYTENFATVPIPEDLKDGDGRITIDVSDPREEINPESADIDMADWDVSLRNLTWWSMQFIEIEKQIHSPYWEQDTETVRRKIVLPPALIHTAFNRLDRLAAELGILLQIQQGRPNNTLR